MSNGNSWQVAPHGIICFAVFALAVLLLIRATGFKAMTAVKVG